MFKCKECGHAQLKWTGSCPSCKKWWTLEEEEDTSRKVGKLKETGKAKQIESLQAHTTEETSRFPVRSKELTTVLWGGITPGSFILLSGEPGIGKSTLTLQIADWFSCKDRSALYVSAEENIGQISGRAKRLGIQNSHIRILCESVFEDILETISSDSSELIILDSISVFWSLSIDSSAGSTGLVRSMAEILMQTAKKSKKTIIVIWHVTKDGTISWPKTLEHLVDTVLFLEWSRHESYRILRSLKNRFGPTDEIGLFQMTEHGLEDIENPGTAFAGNERSELHGSALGITLEWTRPILIEIEALTTYTKFGYPKRSSRGIASGKLDLIIAILSKYTDTGLESYDIFANIGRGMSISEPGWDLALAAAILSSRKNISLGHAVFIGEVSLTGMIKSVHSLERRIEELARFGFTEIITAKRGKKIGKKLESNDMQIIEIGHIAELETYLDRRRKTKTA
jgi:DNA repair protein RadA/Sms